MTAAAKQPAARARKGAWLRHGASLGAALVLNAALAFFLVAWTGRSGRTAQTPVRTVPVTVVDAEVEPAEIVEQAPAAEPLPPPPLAAPPLPALPQPETPAPPLPLDAPLPLELAVRHSTDVPLYVAEVIQPTPAVPVAPRPRPTVRRAAPRADRLAATRGPVLIRPPSLSDYYPRRALLRGITGRTTIRLTIDEAGRVTAIEVLGGEPPGVFEHAARRVGRALHFRPALRGGRAVGATATMNLVWKVE